MNDERTAITVRLTGATALLMHSDKLANPLDPATIELKTMTSDRQLKKTVEGQLAIVRYQWLNSFYLNSEGKVVLPMMNVRKMIIEAARRRKLGKDVERAVSFIDMEFPLNFPDKNAPVEDLWENGTGKYVDSRSVVVGRAKVYAYRPKFDEWTCDITMVVDTSLIDIDTLLDIIEVGGRYVGICDFRPLFGKFTSEVLNAAA